MSETTDETGAVDTSREAVERLAAMVDDFCDCDEAEDRKSKVAVVLRALLAERDALRKALDEAAADADALRTEAHMARGEIAALARGMASEHRSRAARRFLRISKTWDLGAADALDALAAHLEGAND